MYHSINSRYNLIFCRIFSRYLRQNNVGKWQHKAQNHSLMCFLRYIAHPIGYNFYT